MIGKNQIIGDLGCFSVLLYEVLTENFRRFSNFENQFKQISQIHFQPKLIVKNKISTFPCLKKGTRGQQLFPTGDIGEDQHEWVNIDDKDKETKGFFDVKLLSLLWGLK